MPTRDAGTLLTDEQQLSLRRALADGTLVGFQLDDTPARPPRERNRATRPLLRLLDDDAEAYTGTGVVLYACTACGCRSPTPIHASCASVALGARTP